MYKHDPFTVKIHVYVTFDVYKVAKINQYQWKELLKIRTSTIFDGKRLKIRECTAP